jgi:hypothetical protein
VVQHDTPKARTKHNDYFLWMPFGLNCFDIQSILCVRVRNAASVRETEIETGHQHFLHSSRTLLPLYVVVHTCNPSYEGGQDQEDLSSRPVPANNSGYLISTNIGAQWCTPINPSNCKKPKLGGLWSRLTGQKVSPCLQNKQSKKG